MIYAHNIDKYWSQYSLNIHNFGNIASWIGNKISLNVNCFIHGADWYFESFSELDIDFFSSSATEFGTTCVEGLSFASFASFGVESFTFNPPNLYNKSSKVSIQTMKCYCPDYKRAEE